MQVLMILGGLFCGSIGAYLANKRGRHPLIWFTIAFFLGLFALATILFLPKVGKKSEAPPPKKILVKRSDLWLKMWYYLDLHHHRQGPMELPD